MARFFVLMSATQEGARSLDALPEKLAQALDEADPKVGQFVTHATTYAVFGAPFDFIIECEANEFEDVAYLAVTLSKTGLVETTTPQTYAIGDFNTIICQRLGKMAP